MYANTFLNDLEISQEVVQSVFVHLWERKENLKIEVSLSAYLYKSVYYAALNDIKKNNKAPQSVQNNKDLIHLQSDTSKSEHLIQTKELDTAIQKTLEKLPPQCKIVFSLSRFESKKYSEIAALLGISVKAVEKQITKALKIFRIELSDFLPFLLIIFEVLNR